jgi:hypothetical protein
VTVVPVVTVSPLHCYYCQKGSEQKISTALKRQNSKIENFRSTAAVKNIID